MPVLSPHTQQPALTSPIDSVARCHLSVASQSVFVVGNVFLCTIVFTAVGMLIGAAACNQTTSTNNGQMSVSSGVSSAPAASGPTSQLSAASIRARLIDLQYIENTRDISQIQPSDIGHPRAVVRAAAMRALARSNNKRAIEFLTSGLSDVNGHVVSWASFGLGELCQHDANTITSRLVARGANWAFENESAESTALQHLPPNALQPDYGVTNTAFSSSLPADFQPWAALSHALAQCATAPAQLTLTAWMFGPADRRKQASFALGMLAHRNRHIREEVAAAALRSASGDTSNSPLTEALYPFSRVNQTSVRLHETLLSLCNERLSQPGPERIFVLRTFASLGEQGINSLVQALDPKSESFATQSAEEKAQAARSLAIIATPRAKHALLKLLDLHIANRHPTVASLISPDLAVTLAILQSIDTLYELRPSARISQGLKHLANLSLAEIPPGPAQHRAIMLRCKAAQILAQDRYDDAPLVACDPNHSELGQLARIAVIGRASLAGQQARQRVSQWESYLTSKHHPLVRAEALGLIALHPGVKNAKKHVVAALETPHAAVVTQAARLIASHPDRFSATPENKRHVTPDPKVAVALQNAAKKNWPPDLIETRGTIARAAGAIGAVSLVPWMRQLCDQHNVTLSKHAKASLTALGETSPQCDENNAQPVAAAHELTHLLQSPTEVVFETNVGTLRIRIDPANAPVAATRVVQLVESKFYDDLPIHRVEPGFVVQFGDHQHGGYGGANLPPIRCELSLQSFDRYNVGMAHAGKDTGSSQIFVTLASSPHLQGAYTWIGTASGPWNTVVQGDRIKRAFIASCTKNDTTCFANRSNNGSPQQ